MLVDTNVLVDVLQSDPDWADWSIAQLQAQSKVHQLVINPIIDAELSLTFSTVEALDQVLDGKELRMLEIPKPALFLAGKAFVQYRRRGGAKTNVFGDFLIGAHAAVSGLPLLTRDTGRYRTYFPSVKLLAPQLKREAQTRKALHQPRSRRHRLTLHPTRRRNQYANAPVFADHPAVVCAISTSAGMPRLLCSLRIMASVSGRLRLRTS